MSIRYEQKEQEEVKINPDQLLILGAAYGLGICPKDYTEYGSRWNLSCYSQPGAKQFAMNLHTCTAEAYYIKYLYNYIYLNEHALLYSSAWLLGEKCIKLSYSYTSDLYTGTHIYSRV